MMNRRGFLGMITLAAASLLAVGCGTTSLSYVRSVNASPGLTNGTVQVNLTGVASAVPYGTEGVQPKGSYSTLDTTGAYREVAAGTNQSVSIFTTLGKPLATESFSFVKNASYTIVNLGPAASPVLVTLHDGDTAPPSSGAKIRFMSTTGLAGPVDVYLTAPGGTPGGTPFVSGIPFQAVTSYEAFGAGSFEVQVTPAGNPSSVLATANINAAGGKYYSIFFFEPNINTSNYTVLAVNDPVLAVTTTTH